MNKLSNLNPELPHAISTLFEKLTSDTTGIAMSTPKDIPITAFRLAQRIVVQGFNSALKKNEIF